MDTTLDVRGPDAVPPTDAPTALVLHGGGGPGTVTPIAAHLAATHTVLTPTHPGWDGTVRPAGLDSVAALAARYLGLLDDRGVQDALVVGSSLGGWAALEMAVQDAERGGHAVGRVVVVDAVGIEVPGDPVRDISGMAPAEIARYSWHDPAAARTSTDPSALTDERRAQQAANMAALQVYAGGPTMTDPTLAARLTAVAVPALVVWGASDRVVTPAHGAAIAAALPDARLVVVEAAGHLPQLEQPGPTAAALDAFLAETA